MYVYNIKKKEKIKEKPPRVWLDVHHYDDRETTGRRDTVRNIFVVLNTTRDGNTDTFTADKRARISTLTRPRVAHKFDFIPPSRARHNIISLIIYAVRAPTFDVESPRARTERSDRFSIECNIFL